MSDSEKNAARLFCQEALAGLMPCLYGHHLERYGELAEESLVCKILTISSVLVENLNGVQLPRLDELANDNAFFEAYKMEITAPGT